MGKIKLTKGELKRQRDSLKQYERFLPMLQLKKQQIQAELLHHSAMLEEKRRKASEKRSEIGRWAGLLSDETTDIHQWVTPSKIELETKNVAGVDIPVFVQASFAAAEYDLFLMPLWVDNAIEVIRAFVSTREESLTLERAIIILRAELSVTTQRVNLFEKVKIPEAEEAIRLIKIYIGDQMANAVGRSKCAKRKLASQTAQGVTP